MNGFSRLGRYAAPLSATGGFLAFYRDAQRDAEFMRQQRVSEQYQQSLTDINKSRADISQGYLDIAKSREARLSQRPPLGGALSAYGKLRGAVDRGMPAGLAWRFLEQAGVADQFAPYDIFREKPLTPSQQFNNRILGATENWGDEKWQQAAERKFLGGAKGDRTTLNVKGLTDLIESEAYDWRDSLPGAMAETTDVWGTPSMEPDPNFMPSPQDIQGFTNRVSETYSGLSGLPQDRLRDLAQMQVSQIFGVDISPHLKAIQDYAQEELEKSEEERRRKLEEKRQGRLFEKEQEPTTVGQYLRPTEKRIFGPPTDFYRRGGPLEEMDRAELEAARRAESGGEPSNRDLDAALREAKKTLGQGASEQQIIAEARRILQSRRQR